MRKSWVEFVKRLRPTWTMNFLAIRNQWINRWKRWNYRNSTWNRLLAAVFHETWYNKRKQNRKAAKSRSGYRDNVVLHFVFLSDRLCWLHDTRTSEVILKDRRIKILENVQMVSGFNLRSFARVSLWFRVGAFLL